MLHWGELGGGGGDGLVYFGLSENGELPMKQYGTNSCSRFTSRNFEIHLFSSLRLTGRTQGKH